MLSKMRIHTLSQLAACLVLTLVLANLSAQTQPTKDANFGGLETALFKHNESVLVLPQDFGTWQGTSSLDSPFLLRSSEVDNRRRYVVHYENNTYRASVPLMGTRSRVAFDVNRKRFVGLQPSIRVELTERIDPKTIAESLNARKISIFDKLGFAILELPPELHPSEAVKIVRQMPGQPQAFLRTRGFRIEWR